MGRGLEFRQLITAMSNAPAPQRSVEEPLKREETFDGEEVKTVGCTDDTSMLFIMEVLKGAAAQPIGGQCKARGIISPQAFYALLVEGEYVLDCDCQTGLYRSLHSVTIRTPVRVHFTGIITEC